MNCNRYFYGKARPDLFTFVKLMQRLLVQGLVVVLVVVVTTSAQGAESVLDLGVSVKQDYDSNIYRAYQSEEAEWATVVAPSFKITTAGQQASFLVNYSPLFVYNHRTDQDRLDHSFFGRLDKRFGEGLTSFVSDTFLRAEDPYNDEDAGIELSDERGRNRYWSNSASVGLIYEYARQSFLNFYYKHHVLDNESGVLDDYTKSSPSLSFSYLFGQHWLAQADYKLTEGDFDQADDLQTEAVDLFLSYRHSPSAKSFCHYGYSNTDYYGVSVDNDRHNLSFGFDRKFSSKLDFKVEAGGARLSRDNLGDNDSIYYSFSLNNQFQQGTVLVSSNGGMEDRNFTGTGAQGVSRYWVANLGVNYNLFKDMLASINCSYRDDEYLDRQPVEDEQFRQLELALSYSFSRWYQVSLRYIFASKDANDVVNTYDDNRLFLAVSAKKDFLKW